MPDTKKSEYVEIEGELVRPFETEKAYRLDHGGNQPVWLPKSQVDWHPTPREGYSRLGVMVMPRWLAEDKGLV